MLPAPPTNQNQTNKVPLVVGLTFGLLVLAVTVLGGVRGIYLRRGRRPIDAQSISPYTGPPIRRYNQQSSMPQVRKGVPQPARPPGEPMATVDPSMSPRETGLGPPPVMKRHRTNGESTPHNNSKISPLVNRYHRFLCYTSVITRIIKNMRILLPRYPFERVHPN